jgi:hypothetical protein
MVKQRFVLLLGFKIIRNKESVLGHLHSYGTKIHKSEGKNRVTWCTVRRGRGDDVQTERSKVIGKLDTSRAESDERDRSRGR